MQPFAVMFAEDKIIPVFEKKHHFDLTYTVGEVDNLLKEQAWVNSKADLR